MDPHHVADLNIASQSMSEVPGEEAGRQALPLRRIQGFSSPELVRRRR